MRAGRGLPTSDPTRLIRVQIYCRITGYRLRISCIDRPRDLAQEFGRQSNSCHGLEYRASTILQRAKQTYLHTTTSPAIFHSVPNALLTFGFHGGVFALGFLKAMHDSDRLASLGAWILFNTTFRYEPLRSAIIPFFRFTPLLFILP